MTANEHRFHGRLRGAILDWAGTIIDHGSCAPAGVFVEVFRRQGVTISLEEARGPMGAQKRDHIHQLLVQDAIAQRFQEARGRPHTDADVDALYDAFVPLQISCLPDHSVLIPRAASAVEILRDKGLKIATTTGYSREMLAVLLPEAERQGLHTNVNLSASDVPAGRPAPWMCFRAMERMWVYPPAACLKVGDTLADIEAGLNAGMWSVGVVMTGNEVGLSRADLEALDPDERKRLRDRGYQRMHDAGAHWVVDSVADVPPLVDEINERLARGEHP